MEEKQETIIRENQYLTFKLNSDFFAIGILAIKEIIEYGKITRVPMTPDFIKGVYNLRGQVVPVINLASLFKLPSSPVTTLTCIVIVETEVDREKQSIGIIVDQVDEVQTLQHDQIEPPPSFGAKISSNYIQGMGKIKDQFIILLSVAKMLDLSELSDFDKYFQKEKNKGKH